MIQSIRNKIFDEERALYHLCDATVEDCSFSGSADGESALKESANVSLLHCHFFLRYPLWHSVGFSMVQCDMSETCRAPLWYAQNGKIENCDINGVKCLRECTNIEMEGCRVVSPEFGWRCKNLSFGDCSFTSEYFLFEAANVAIKNMNMKGKYSFQYIQNMTIEDSFLDTKDAFWHTKNVTVKNSTVRGEYLGWYSENLTLVGCKIIGTQPLCYCKGLKLIDCEMEETDLAFEYSEVEATVKGDILSVKNPLSGSIIADGYGEVIFENSVKECKCLVEKRSV